MSKKPFIRRPKKSAQKSNQNILTAFLPLTGAMVSLIYAFIFEFYFKYPLASSYSITFFVLYLLSQFLFKYKLHELGIHFVTIVFSIQISLHTFYLFPITASFHLFYLVGIPLLFIIFEPHYKISRIVYSSAFILLLSFVEFTSLPSVFTLHELNEEMISFIKRFNVFTSVSVLSITILLFINMMEKSKQLAFNKSITDYLTGLLNRRQFFYLADLSIAKHLENKQPLILVFLDLDHFKTINDDYGHNIGDEVLLSIANTLQDYVHKNDIVARIGGEEFVIIFENTSCDHGIAKAEVIRQAVLAAKIPYINKQITVSMGLTQLTQQDKTINQLLKRADSALYQAKQKGRNRIETDCIKTVTTHDIAYTR